MRRQTDPLWDQLVGLRRNFDDLFSFMAPPVDSWVTKANKEAWCPAVESYVKDGKFTLKVQIPGVDAKDLKVSTQGEVLTIRGEKNERSESKDANFLCREFRYGAFERNVALPEGTKTEALEASYGDGELIITAPVTAKALPRNVAVKVGQAAEVRKTAA